MGCHTTKYRYGSSGDILEFHRYIAKKCFATSSKNTRYN